MIAKRYRTTQTVHYADSQIPAGIELEELNPEHLDGYIGRKIKEQVTEGLAKPKKGMLPPTPVRVIEWAGKIRTCPEAFLECVEP